MRAAAIIVPLAGVIPRVASFAERRSYPDHDRLLARETGHPSDKKMPHADLMIRDYPPAVTAAPKPRYVGANLFARQDDSNTCGYIHYNDDPNNSVYPITCDPAYICTNVGNMRDCCRSNYCASTTFSTACLDSISCPIGGPDAGTFCCTSTRYPYCVSYLWSSSTNTKEVFTLLNCRVDTSSRIGTLEAESTTRGVSTTPAVTTVTSTSPATTTTPSNDGGGSSTPVGPIVGGVVGGVAAIGLAAIAIIFMVKKRKREATEASSPPPAPSNPQSPPMQQQPYNPHQSYQSSQQPFNTHQSFYGATPTSPDPTSIYPSPSQSPGPFQAYNPANGPATSPGPQYSIQPTPPGFVPQPYTEPGKTGPDVNTMSADPTPSPGVPDNTSPGATGVFQPPQNVYTVQQPGQFAEAPAINPVGSNENRAELS